MVYRDDVSQLRARVEALEAENAELRRELGMLRGATALAGPPPAPTQIGQPLWWPGDSWILGVSREGLLAYTGEASSKQYVRIAKIGESVLADYELTKDGARFARRVRGAIVAPLADGTLARIDWPGHELSARFKLSSKLLAPVVETNDGILALNGERELLVIDPVRFCVKERKRVSAPDAERLGLAEKRNQHNGYEAPDWMRDAFGDGWNLAGFRSVGELALCAFDRDFGATEQVAAAVFSMEHRKPLWFAELGEGHFMYLYELDGLLVLHNVSMEVPPQVWALECVSGRMLFRISERGKEARGELFLADGKVRSFSL